MHVAIACASRQVSGQGLLSGGVFVIIRGIRIAVRQHLEGVRAATFPHLHSGSHRIRLLPSRTGVCIKLAAIRVLPERGIFWSVASEGRCKPLLHGPEVAFSARRPLAAHSCMLAILAVPPATTLSIMLSLGCLTEDVKRCWPFVESKQAHLPRPRRRGRCRCR